LTAKPPDADHGALAETIANLHHNSSRLHMPPDAVGAHSVAEEAIAVDLQKPGAIEGERLPPADRQSPTGQSRTSNPAFPITRRPGVDTNLASLHKALRPLLRAVLSNETLLKAARDKRFRGKSSFLHAFGLDPRDLFVFAARSGEASFDSPL
jgi:hypothetical protein